MRSFTQQLDSIPDQKCQCHASSQTYEQAKKLFGNAEEFLGVDKTEGRFGEVSTYGCLECGTKFIRYRIEYPPFKNSDRWYIGVANDAIIQQLRSKPEGVVPYLEQLDWFIFGGNFFSSNGRYGKGKVFTDLI